MTATPTRNGWPLPRPVRLHLPDRDGPPPTYERDADGDARERLADALHPPRRPTATLDRATLLDATAACLREYGYDGTTIRRIAGRLGCAVGSIYRYAVDKRELLTAVCDRRFEPVLETLDREGVDASAARYLRLAAEQPETYRLMLWLAARPMGENDAPPLPGVVRELIDGWAERLGDRGAAERAWVELHGRALLGESTATPAVTTPLRLTPDEADSEPSLSADEPDADDMTLL